MRVCYFGTYRDTYIRNRLMIERLRQNGVDVVECHVTLWQGMEDREQAAAGGWKNPRFLWRFVSAYARLIGRYLKVGKYDVMIVGYPGQPDMPLARLLSWLAGKPLVWDVLMSIYLIALERGLEKRSPLTVKLIRWLESLACRLPDWFILDTPEYSLWFQETYQVPPERIRLVPLGADDRVFKPLAAPERTDGLFRCLYYGTFIPNHGVLYIIEAARLLRDQPEIHFELVGAGPEREQAEALAREYGLANVTFTDWLDKPELAKQIACADVCLGTFGLTPQALMTMQNKIHECFAMQRPVINGDSPVMRSALVHGEQIYLCERANPQAIAEAVLALHADPALRRRLAENGYRHFQEHTSFEKLGQVLVEHMETFSRKPGR